MTASPVTASIRKTAILGAGGAIGHAVAPELERRGIPFRVVGRTRQTLVDAYGASVGAEIVDADLADPAQAERAVKGVDTILYAVGVPYPAFEKHPAQMRVTLDAAIRAGVEHLLLVSSVYSYGVPLAARVAETHAREPQTANGKNRKLQEDMVMEAHGSGALRTMVVRLPDFYGPHANRSLGNPLFKSALDGKTANWVGPPGTPHEFLFVPDAGPVLVEIAAREDCYGETWNLGGVEAIPGLDFITRIYRAVGREPEYRSLGRTLLLMGGAINPVLKELAERLYLQETPVILDDSKLAAKLGELRKTTYDEGIRRTLQWMRPE